MDHQIIYRLVDDVKAKLSEQLAPNITHRVTGEAEVAQIFDISVKGRASKPVAGCKVRNGLISRNAKVRVLREKEVIYTGMISSPTSSPDPELQLDSAALWIATH
jgi:translation initiation factor IF-2